MPSVGGASAGTCAPHVEHLTFGELRKRSLTDPRLLLELPRL